MTCNDKITYTCSGGKTFAKCSEYQGDLPAFSSLTTGCVSVEDAIMDVYGILSTVKNEIDMSSMSNECITFTTPKTVASVITQMYEKICDLQQKNEEQDITIAALTLRIADVENNNCP